MQKKDLEISKTDGNLSDQINNVMGKSEDVIGEKPTEEETKEVKKEYEDAVEDWKVVKFDLSPVKELGSSFIEYINDFLNNKFLWTQNAWMGSIKLDEEMKECVSSFKSQPKDSDQAPQIGFQALEFIVYMLNNPAGIGLASAKDFEDVSQQHETVLAHMLEKQAEARKILDHIKYLQDKWAAYEQGFYFDKEPTDDEMPEGSYFDEDLQKYIKPGDEGYDIQKFIQMVKEHYGEETAAKVLEDMENEIS